MRGTRASIVTFIVCKNLKVGKSYAYILQKIKSHSSKKLSKKVWFFITHPLLYFTDFDPFFIATFATSLISASKGIASFLLDGPCKLVSKNGLFGGLGSMGFIFLCLNIIATLIGKGLMLAFTYNRPPEQRVSTYMF